MYISQNEFKYYQFNGGIFMTNSNSTAHAQAVQALFQPFKLGKLTLPNRIVMAPMTRGFSPDGVPGQNVADYYRRRAEGGVGLIITEGTLINHPASASSPNYPSFFGEAALRGWAEVVASVHQAGRSDIPSVVA
jgi:2,4-dienoyl-CoA reductase-like NADH-dependent reductase (Old Yellow Enzyme family)